MAAEHSAIDAMCPAEGGMVSFKVDGLWGYIDVQGKLSIPPQFDAATPFSEGVAAVQSNKLWGFVDRSGQWVVPAKFSDARSFSSGLAAAEWEGRWGYIDKAGQWVVAPKYNAASQFSGEVAIVDEGYQRDVMINNRGEVIKRFGPEVSVSKHGPFGLFQATEKFHPFLQKADGRQMPFPGAPQYGHHFQYAEGLALAAKATKQNGQETIRWGAVDSEGHWVIPAQFAELTAFSQGLAVATLDDGSPTGCAQPQSCQRALIDKKGRIVTAARYTRISAEGREGLYQATLPDGRGFDLLSKAGQVVLPASTCPEKAGNLYSTSAPAGWHLFRGCGKSWLLSGAVLMESGLSNPEVSASATHVLLVEDPLDSAEAAIKRFELFDVTGRLVLSSESPQMQGDNALRSHDTIELIPVATALSEEARRHLPVASIFQGDERVRLVSRDSHALIDNAQWVPPSTALSLSFRHREDPLTEGPWPMYTRQGWGAIDNRGQWIVAPDYRQLTTFRHGMAFARDATGEDVILDHRGRPHALPAGQRFERVGAFELLGISDDGRESVRFNLQTQEVQHAPRPDSLQEVDVEAKLAPAERGGLWGLVDREGTWVVPARFAGRPEAVTATLGEGSKKKLVGWRTSLAIMDNTERLHGWLTPEGREVAPPLYSAIALDEKAGVLLISDAAGLKGVLSLDGRHMIEPAYQNLKSAGEGWYLLEKPDFHGLLKADGEWAWTPQPFPLFFEGERPFFALRRLGAPLLFDRDGRISTATSPLAPKQDSPQWWWSPEDFGRASPAQQTVFYGFDFIEKLRVPGRVASFARFSEGVVSFKPSAPATSCSEQIGLIDQQGRVLGRYDYAEIGAMQGGFAVFDQAIGKPPRHEACGRMATGNQTRSTRSGYLDRNGRVAIPARFEAAGPFSEKRAVVVWRGNLGLIDTQGKLLVHSAWLCGREPVVLGPGEKILWPEAASKKTKC